MELTEEELKMIIRAEGCKKGTHAFFDTKEYNSLVHRVIDSVPTAFDERLQYSSCTIDAVVRAGKYVIEKHADSIDTKVPYSPGDYLRSFVISKFGQEPKKEDYEKIHQYIRNKSELREATDIPITLDMNSEIAGLTRSSYIYGLDCVDLDFYDNLPIVTSQILLGGDCDEYTKTVYVHELYHVLLNKHKGNVQNYLNEEVFSIFMEKVAALDLDSSQQLLDKVSIDRLVDIKKNIFNRLGCVFCDESYLDTIDYEKYILSILEATALFNTYKRGSNRIKKEIDTDINKVITGYSTVEDVLDKYEAEPENGSKLLKRQLNQYYRNKH